MSTSLSESLAERRGLWKLLRGRQRVSSCKTPSNLKVRSNAWRNEVATCHHLRDPYY